MRSVTTNLIAAVVVLHAVLGCCMHHSHASESACASASSPAHAESGCRHHHVEASASHGPDHGGQGCCHEEKCDFIRPPRDDSKVTTLGMWPAGTPISLGGELNLARQVHCHADLRRPACLLPVRLHLAKMVLLI